MMSELHPRLLVAAYAQGIFPMAYDTGEIVWFSPDPRAIFELDAFHASRSLRRTYRQGKFQLTVDRDFPGVIDGCADRPEGTWISREIRAAYLRLHKLGVAHSIEAWREDRLAGGVYGVALGGAFCGESMFHRVRDASKVCLLYLVDRLRACGFTLFDVQFSTPHLERLGCKEISRAEYLRRLDEALDKPCKLTASH